MKQKKKKEIVVDEKSIHESSLWLEENKSIFPDYVFDIIQSCLKISEKITEVSAKNNALRKILGSIFNGQPKSEKGSTDIPDSKNTSEDQNTPENSDNKKKPPHKSKLHDKRVHRRKKRKTKTPKKKKSKNSSGNSDEKNDNNLSSDAAYLPIPENGRESIFDKIVLPKEDAIFTMDKSYLRSEFNKRSILNIKFVVEEYICEVETVTNIITGQRVTAEVGIAPPYSGYSYQTILHFIHQHVEYLIPLHRLERMYSSMLGVSRSTIYRFCVYAAQAFLPIYTHLFEELIQNASLIQMDDTKTKILNETKEKEFEEEDEEETIEEKNTKRLIDPKLSVHKKIHESIGLLSYTKSKKSLKKTNVTLLTGETIPGNSQSRISVFLTHFGQAGDLLDRLLIKRKKISAPLNIVCDLASFNKTSEENTKTHNVIINGCAAHSRRMFWKCRELGDELYYILRGFALLYEIEDLIRDCDDKKILHYRQKYARRTWELMIHFCETKIISMWPEYSAPHQAAKYLMKNRVELMAYLDKPRVPIDNNRSEQGLRPEKLMLASCKFRFNSEGRAIFDVLRTLLTCVRHARIDWQAYATDVLKNRERIAMAPHLWTPFAWKMRQETIRAK